MKTKLVETITNDEEFIRMRIYDGELNVDQAAEELIRLARAQRDAAIQLADVRLDRLRAAAQQRA